MTMDQMQLKGEIRGSPDVLFGSKNNGLQGYHWRAGNISEGHLLKMNIRHFAIGCSSPR